MPDPSKPDSTVAGLQPSPAASAAACADAYEHFLNSRFDAIVAETNTGGSDTHDMVCGTHTAWLSELHEALPDLAPSEARFLMLLAIARKSNQISERALDLMAEQRRAHPELQELIDELMADDDSELGGAA
jgi:hypothetical protein